MFSENILMNTADGNIMDAQTNDETCLVHRIMAAGRHSRTPALLW